MRRILASAAATALAAVAAAAAPAAAQTPTLALPEPTGRFETGVTELHLVDEDRADAWVPSEDREMMVSVWYPTEADGPAAPYMTGEESEAFLQQLAVDVPPDLFAEVETNSVEDAEPLGEDRSLPLVVLSPGFSFPRATLTGTAEDLAGHGYVVAAVGHKHEAPISFPGRFTECLACADSDPDRLVTERAADLSHVVDELTEGAAWRGADLIDPGRVAVGGHSLGGASSHRAMSADDRFAAGFNLDGTFFALDRHRLDRPFMMVGAQEHGQPGEDKTWSKAWRGLTGWKRWITVEGSAHSTFTDLAPLADQAGLPLQEMDGAYADRLTRAHVLAFADTHLKCQDSPILDGPNDTWPEVVFHHPK